MLGVMRAEIVLEFDVPDDARRVLVAVLPDNAPLPKGLILNSNIRENKLVFTMASERGLESLAATIEDLMSAVDLSFRTVKSLETRNCRSD